MTAEEIKEELDNIKLESKRYIQRIRQLLNMFTTVLSLPPQEIKNLKTKLEQEFNQSN